MTNIYETFKWPMVKQIVYWWLVKNGPRIEINNGREEKTAVKLYVCICLLCGYGIHYYMVNTMSFSLRLVHFRMLKNLNIKKRVFKLGTFRWMADKVMVIFAWENLYSFCEHGGLVCVIALINFWWVNMGADVMVLYSMVYKFQSFR